MASGPAGTVLAHLRHIVGPRGDADSSDAELLRRFAVEQDEAAFAALVRRHGPMVLGVCRRILDDTHAADDAFQATFLLLVRKARSIGRPELLANWLYGVAYRVARKARAAMSRRRTHSVYHVDDIPAKPQVEIALDLRPILDEEVHRLPPRYRGPVVLCYLEGKSNDEAARQLGCPVGTVWGRLSRARDLLRERLARRGVALSLAALGTALAEGTACAVPSVLAERTVRAGVSVVGGTALAEATSAPVASLIRGVARDLALVRIQPAIALVAALALALGAGVALCPTPDPAGLQGFALPAPEVGADAPLAVQVATADEEKGPTLLGSSRWQPSPAQPIGWRGDGTGRYPSATPPTAWGRKVSTVLQEFRCQAMKPAADDEKKAKLLEEQRGSGTCHFGVTDWLILGPLDPLKADGEALDQPILEKEAELTPQEGDKVGKLAWQRTEGPDVNFTRLLGAAEPRQVAYAFTYVYSPKATGAGIRTKGLYYGLKFRTWLNGKPASNWEQQRHPFQQGWNRLLMKIEAHGGTPEWLFRAYLAAFAADVSYKTEGVFWHTPLPGPSYATPIIVGDRLFVTSEPSDLICLDKATGKPRWVRSHPSWLAVDAADRAEFDDRDELDGLAKKLEDLNTAFLKPMDDKTRQERRKLATDLTERVKKANRKYAPRFGWGGGNSGPTPTSDGKHVFVWHGETGVLACLDLDGNRKYVRFHAPGRGGEHGFNSSPVLVNDLLVVIGGGCVLAFDKATGAERWRQENYRHPCYPTLVVGKVGDVPVVVTADGSVYRAADGKLLQGAFGRDDGECASAVLDGDRYHLISRAGYVAARLPENADGTAKSTIINRLAPADLKPTETYPVGSPVCHQDLVYATHSGWASKDGRTVLFALDPRAPKPVYVQTLDFYPHTQYEPKGAGSAASLTFAGKHIFVMDNRGTTIVFEPGPTFKPIAKNTLSHMIGTENRQEVTQSTPIFEGKRIYYRAEEMLYCIGE